MARGGDRILGARHAYAAILHFLLDLRFQRVGDLIWAAADMRSARFLLGATAGRTTLSARACSTRTLQPPDRLHHSDCRAYDPCFGYELAVILHDGMRRMLDAQEDVFLLRHGV